MHVSSGFTCVWGALPLREEVIPLPQSPNCSKTASRIREARSCGVTAGSVGELKSRWVGMVGLEGLLEGVVG